MKTSQLIDNGIEEANRIGTMQYIHERKCQKVSFENLVEPAVAYGKLFHMVKYADVLMVEYCEHKQRKVLR